MFDRNIWLIYFGYARSRFTSASMAGTPLFRMTVPTRVATTKHLQERPQDHCYLIGKQTIHICQRALPRAESGCLSPGSAESKSARQMRQLGASSVRLYSTKNTLRDDPGRQASLSTTLSKVYVSSGVRDLGFIPLAYLVVETDHSGFTFIVIIRLEAHNPNDQIIVILNRCQ